MKKILILFSLIILGCKPNSIKISTPNGYQLFWADEFDKGLDVSKWAYRTDNKHRSIQLKENVSVENGVLTLNLNVLEEAVQGKYASGAGIVSTERFKYGYYEVRARLGDGIDDDKDGKTDEGWHHSFWAMAAVIENEEVSTTYPGTRRTEIDCFENPTEHISEPIQNGLNNFTQHVIIWDEDGQEYGRLPVPPTDITSLENFDAGEWHKYAFEWNEKEIKFYVDDKLQKIAHYPSVEFVHDEINIWITAIAANWNADDQEKSSAQYDYFRFFKRNDKL